MRFLFVDRWVSGRNHTPAKGAASNRGSRVQIPLCPPLLFILIFQTLIPLTQNKLKSLKRAFKKRILIINKQSKRECATCVATAS